MKIGIAIAWVAVSVAACDAPGEGRNFERARREAEAVMAALSRYRTDAARYPHRLDALSPRYLPRGFFESNRPGRATTYFDFRRVDAGTYDFAFGYDGPGMNHCDYIRGTAPPRWNCSGHY